MTYVDGFVAAAPTANKQKFIDHAQKGDSMFVEAGAIRVVECWGDDVPEGSRLLSASRESGGRRDRHLLVDRVARQGDAGRRDAEGDGRPADAAGREPDAIRREAPGLRRPIVEVS